MSAFRADDLPHHLEEGSIAMSHHLDTPLAAQNGQRYIDDLYVFSGDGSTVFIMDVNSNITGVHVKPGFQHEARYEFAFASVGRCFFHAQKRAGENQSNIVAVTREEF